MNQISSVFSHIEQALWRHRTAILACGVALTIVRLWWYYSPLPEQARYPVREMLVNSSGGFVRRGISGDIILTLSNTFGGATTAWATAILCILGAVLFATSLAIFRALPDDTSLTPMVLAPWGLLFMAYDADVLIRKEAFGFLALSMLLIGALCPRPKPALIWLGVSCATMPLAILFHEANAALVGPMLIASWLFTRSHPAQNHIARWAIAFGIAASVLASAAVMRNMTTTPEAMCAAINDPQCHAPFSYFNDQLSDGFGFVLSQISPTDLIVAAGMMCAAALPFAGIRGKTIRPFGLIALGVAIILPVVPLFVVAADYGRWIVMIMFPASLLTTAALSLGHITYRQIAPSWVVVLYCGTWSIYHYRVDLQWMGWMIWIFLLLALIVHWGQTRLRRAPARKVPS